MHRTVTSPPSLPSAADPVEPLVDTTGPTASPSWIGLVGPTASGKSALALAIAKRFKVEIVSVDSALVYRGMDIGTAKPSAAERAAVRHHLIDLIEPTQSYSAATFVRDANRAMAEIRARGATPLLVGGTMLYVRALLAGLDDMPAADATVRAAIDAQAREHGWPHLHAELARHDPVTAARLAPNDAQRIQRALEVYRVSGKPLSAWHQAEPKTLDASMLISLEPSSRAWLHERIATRFDLMLQAGLMDEVRTLRAQHELHADMPSMRCVGYRQAWEAIDDPSLQASLRERGIAATRQLAKRQLTWLRGMPGRTVVACDAAACSVEDEVLRAVGDWPIHPGMTG